jgi:hypothetical protein
MALVRRQAALSGNPYDAHLPVWRARRVALHGETAWKEQIARFEAIDHGHFARTTVSETERAARGTSHALGRARPGDQRPGEADFSPPLPFAYVLHDLMASLGRLPLWQDVVAHLKTSPELLLAPYCERFGWPLSDFAGDWDAHRHTRSVRFRTGNAYYSFLREAHLAACLRERYGFKVEYHTILDLEWKHDLIVDDLPLALFVNNRQYRQHADEVSRGRKRSIGHLNPARRTASLVMEARAAFGNVWLVDREAMKRIADRLLYESARWQVPAPRDIVLA